MSKTLTTWNTPNFYPTHCRNKYIRNKIFFDIENNEIKIVEINRIKSCFYFHKWWQNS